MNPSVSVIIPTYNCGGFIQQAVLSVRAQEWPNLEIIVVDDGSTDGTAEALSQLRAPDICVLRQANAGVAAARNTGIRAACGEWIAFLDADDLWLPGKLAAQFKALDQSGGASFCYTDARLQLAGGPMRDLKWQFRHQSSFTELLWGNHLHTPTVVVRRDALRQLGPFDAELRTGEDWDMWLRLAARHQAIRVPAALALVRVPSDANKYSADLLEHCTLRVLGRVFSDPGIASLWPNLPALRARVFAWHYAVLAKTYLCHRRVRDSARLAFAAARSHHSGMHFMLPGSTRRLYQLQPPSQDLGAAPHLSGTPSFRG